MDCNCGGRMTDYQIRTKAGLFQRYRCPGCGRRHEIELEPAKDEKEADKLIAEMQR